jgi:transcriptional regulator with XRE-family HTH domain
MLANRLKQLRSEHKMTQRELAKALNISNGTVAMYETSKRSPDYKTLEKIADFYKVSTDYLLGRNSNTINANSNHASLDQQLEEVLQKLQSDGSPLMYKGQPINESTKEALLISLKHTLELADKMNNMDKSKH